MNDPIRDTPSTACCGGRKVLALVSVLLLFGIGIYAARDVTPAPSSVVAGEKATATAAQWRPPTPSLTRSKPTSARR